MLVTRGVHCQVKCCINILIFFFKVEDQVSISRKQGEFSVLVIWQLFINLYFLYFLVMYRISKKKMYEWSLNTLRLYCSIFLFLYPVYADSLYLLKLFIFVFLYPFSGKLKQENNQKRNFTRAPKFLPFYVCFHGPLTPPTKKN